MLQLAGLRKQYIEIRRSGSNVIAYGGDQGFFKETPSGDEDERKQRLGCGITAFGDLLLYLASCNNEYLTEENKSYVNHILTQEEYMTYYNYIYKFMGGIKAGARNGISGFRLQRRFNRMAGKHKWKLRAMWGLSERKLYDRIEEMLSRDIPVILCIPMMFGKKNKGHGICFYKMENGRLCARCTVSAHYVIITGLIEKDGEIYIRISSWGTMYYISWKEYSRLIHTHFMGTILGNILYIR